MRVRPLALLLAAAALAAGTARAQMPETPPGKWWKRPAVVQALALTPEQQDKLDQIFAKNRRDFVDLKADAEKKQLDLEELMAKKDSDPKKVTAAIDALEQSRAKLRRTTSLMLLEMRGVLDEAQWKKVVERAEQWRQERWERFREGGPRHGAEGAPPGPPRGPRPTAGPKE